MAPPPLEPSVRSKKFLLPLLLCRSQHLTAQSTHVSAVHSKHSMVRATRFSVPGHPTTADASFPLCPSLVLPPLPPPQALSLPPCWPMAIENRAKRPTSPILLFPRRPQRCLVPWFFNHSSSSPIPFFSSSFSPSCSSLIIPSFTPPHNVCPRPHIQGR